MDKFKKKLEQLEEKGRLRSLNLPAGVDLTSNDYLGFSVHPSLRAAAIQFLENDAIGAAGSRLLRGHVEAHASLETYAAQFFGTEAALYFSSGFQANYALFTTLPDRHDVILYDELVHASARDGIRASDAKAFKVPHNDLDAYEAQLKQVRTETKGQIWIAIESVYSMDGDFAPVKELYELAKAYDAVLIVDEAHASGVWGQGGKGLAYGLPQDNVITVHTCGKAMGVAGGLICASKSVIDYMVNAARPFIYSTAPMPLQAHLVQKALEFIGSAEGQARRDKLLALCEYAQGKLGGAGSQIVPIILGDDARAVEVAEALQKAGYDIRAIRPPTVPEGTARLRLSLSSELTPEILDGFFEVLMPYLDKEKAA